MPSRIEIRETDITTLQIDAIVNAAHPSLLPATELERHLHQMAGPKLAEECKLVAPCLVGEARITRAYDLPANFVIHTAGPAWGGGEANEDDYLKNCYKNCFEFVKSYHIDTIAFPTISAGENGFPEARAALIAMTEIINHLKTDQKLKSVILACNTAQEVGDYETAFDKLTG